MGVTPFLKAPGEIYSTRHGIHEQIKDKWARITMWGEDGRDLGDCEPLRLET